MAAPRFIWIVLLVLFLAGCSAEQAKAPTDKIVAPVDIENSASHTQLELPAVDKQSGVTKDTSIPAKPVVNQPGTGPEQGLQPPAAALDPVIVQSMPEETADTDMVLNDISHELDSLTQVLKDLEASETTWNQEVTAQ